MPGDSRMLQKMTTWTEFKFKNKMLSPQKKNLGVSGCVFSEIPGEEAGQTI